MSVPTGESNATHLRFNFAVGLMDGAFFGLGMGFGSFSAIIPLFVHHLTESALLIGLVPAIHNMGFQLPQLLTAGWLARAKRYKPLTLLMTVHERVPFLGLSVLALFVPQIPKGAVLILTFGMLIWQGLGAGLAANPWTNLITKVIPRELHGTFFGTQSAAFNALAGISAVAASVILGRVAEPLSYSLCFALTFAAMAVSFAFLAATREGDSIPRLDEHPRAYWGKSMKILGTDRNFRAFLIVRVISQFAAMAFAFYVIYAVQQYNMSDAAAAIPVVLLLIGQVVLGPLMGRLGDRWSHRGVMSIGGVGAALSALLAWKAPGPAWFYAVFLLEAVAIVAIWTVPLAMSVSFAAHEKDRPIYVGLANTIPAPAAVLAPVLGGLLADVAGFETTFLVSATAGLIMAASLWFFVKDPVPVGLSVDVQVGGSQQE